MLDLNLLKQQATKQGIPLISDEVKDYLNNFIKQHQLQHLLEIGSAVGYSALALALNNQTLKIVTLERDALRYQHALMNIDAAQLTKQIELVQVDALQYKTTALFDLIFLDGAKAQSLAFIDHFYQNLLPEGYFIVDNLNFHDLVKQYPNLNNRNTRQLVGKIIRFKETIMADERFNCQLELAIGDGLAIIQKRPD